MLSERAREILGDLLDCRDHEVTVDTRARPGSQVTAMAYGSTVGLESFYGGDTGAWLSLVAHGLLAQSASGKLRLTALGVETAQTWRAR